MSDPKPSDLAAAAVIHLPLSLRAHDRPVHPPAAWFIPGSSARRWAEEMSAWGVPLAGAKLYCVPASLRDRSPCGVLVVPASGARPPAVRLAQPYGLVAGRLYLPVASSLHPPIADDELHAAVPYDVAVMHPAVRLVGFGREDALTVSDLLRPPPPSSHRWDAADPGVAPPPGLLSVQPEDPPTLERMLDLGRDDIGSESPAELPRAPDESVIRDAAARLGLSLARAAQWLRSAGRGSKGTPPGGAKAGHASSSQGGGMFSSMAGWFRSRARAVSAGLEAARQRELQRLLKLLASDPDAGLRHAIPLTSHFAARGRATPGGTLTPHGTDFRLGALGGGRPADAWDVPQEVQRRLREEYRRAATRELQLGRYRRAAYVFAELLGDYRAAATVLRQGRFYREAAVLYRDKLNQPLAAAQCLEEAGLLAEAAEAYGALREYEKAGDLLAKIDRLDAARERWREAVALHLTRHDRLAAARLLETKLVAPDEALTLLAAAWPSDERAADCLREQFNLLGRLGRHDDATSRVRQVVRDAAPYHAATLSATLATVAGAYANPAVREAAADGTRVVVGRHLRDAGTSDTTSLLKALAKLDAGDRLLSRDAERYMRQRQQAQAALTARRPPAPPTARRPAGVVMLRSFHLGADVHWLAVAGHDEQFFAYGIDAGRGAVLVRGRWDGRMQRVVGPPGAGSQPPPYLFYLPERKLLAMPSNAGPAAMWYCPADGEAPAIAVGAPNFLAGEDVLAARLDQGDRVWTLEADDRVAGQSGGLSVSAYRWSTGHVLASHAVQVPPPSDGATPISRRFAARGGTVAIGAGSTLFLQPGDQQPAHRYEAIPLHDEVRSVVASRPMMSANLVVTFAEGAALVREEQPIDLTRFGEGLVEPLATHLYTGGLVLVDQAGQGRVYDLRTAGLARPMATPTASFDTASPHPIALLPGARLSEFAVVSADGLVQVFAAARN